MTVHTIYRADQRRRHAIAAPGIDEAGFRYMFEEYDALKFGTDYRVPVYYIMCENDYQTPIPLAVALFEQLTAPGGR